MVTSSYPRYPGDRAGTFIKSLADELASSGRCVRVLVPRYSGGRREPSRIPNLRLEEFGYAPSDRLHIMGHGQSLAGDRWLRRSSYLLIGPYLVSALCHVIALARRNRVGVLHGQWVLPSGPIVALAGRLLRLPYVISLHGSDVFVAEKTPTFGLVAKWVFRGATAVTACSSDLAARAVRLGAQPGKVAVIPYGVDSSRFVARGAEVAALRESLGIAPTTPVVLALGRLVYKKGFDYLIKAFPSILQDHPTTTLVVAGDGDNLQELRALATSLGVSHQVIFPGVADWRAIPSYLGMADVFALPSIHDDDGNVDGLPNTLLEAMAAGCPVVASDVGGVSSVIRSGRNGVLVRERSSEELAVAIRLLLGSPERRRGLGAAARQLVEHELTWSQIAERYADIYRRARAG